MVLKRSSNLQSGTKNLVSVIIPCYNSEKYLQETLDSVYAQNYENIEIICVDNGSVDSTVALIKSNRANHPELQLFHEPEKGASRARNLGLEHSKGTFIQFLDSDDIITVEKIEKQLQYLVENKLDVVISDRVTKDETLDMKLETITFAEIIEHPLETAISKIIITGNPLYTKKVVESVGGYTSELPMAQDWDFHIKLFLNNPRIGYLKGEFLVSRQIDTSLSSDWYKVSYFGAEVIKSYRDQLYAHNSMRDMMAFNKVIRVYLDTAIYSSLETIKMRSIKELLYWNQLADIASALNGINRTIYKLFGLKVFIRIKRLKSKKLDIS